MTLTWRVTSEARLPEGLAGTLAANRLALWKAPGALWAPRTIAVHDGDGVLVAAALTTARPYNAYRKIVDLIVAPQHDEVEAYAAALRGAIDDVPPNADGTRPAPIVVRFEEHPSVAPLSTGAVSALHEAGFVRDPDPVPSVPSTVPGNSAHVRSWSQWREAKSGASPVRGVPYYGQTTDVTCGAVAALTALEAAGLGRFGSDGADNHGHELAFWRRATNLPACEPIGLGVTTATEVSAHTPALGTPRVILSTDEYVLLEEFADDPLELKLRQQLQKESLREAQTLGVPVERRWIEVAEIRDLVASGSYVCLLIDLEPLIADPTPHWVLAHDVIGDTLIVTDPWIEAPRGESWVDTSAQPITLAGIDRITRWGDPVIRSVIVIPAAS
jgi:hypothetical protein